MGPTGRSATKFGAATLPKKRLEPARIQHPRRPFMKDADRWRTESVTLRPIDFPGSWIYLVSFQQLRRMSDRCREARSMNSLFVRFRIGMSFPIALYVCAVLLACRAVAQPAPALITDGYNVWTVSADGKVQLVLAIEPQVPSVSGPVGSTRCRRQAYGFFFDVDESRSSHSGGG
jgi:hypothetical protein